MVLISFTKSISHVVLLVLTYPMDAPSTQGITLVTYSIITLHILVMTVTLHLLSIQVVVIPYIWLFIPEVDDR